MKLKEFKNKFSYKFGTYFLGKGLVGIINFLLVPIYSKNMIPQEFAKVALLILFIQITTSILKLGQEASFSIKFYKFNKEERSKALYTIFINYSIAGFLLICILSIANDTISKLLSIEINQLIIIKMFALIFFTAITEFFFNLLKMEQNALYYLIATVFFTLSKVSLLIYFIAIKNRGYLAYIDAGVLAYSLFAFIGIVYILKHYYIKNYNFDKKMIKNLLLIGIPTIPALIFSLILNSGDQYILKFYGLISSVGIYAISYKFAGAFSSFIILPFRYALVPIAMKKGNEDIESFKKFMKIILENFISGLYLITLLVYTFFNQIFYLVIDEKYYNGFDIIWIIIFSLIIWGSSNILGNVIVLYEQTSKTMLLMGTAAILNILFNIVLIPIFDFNGAAYATLLSYLIVTILYYNLSQKILKIDYDLMKVAYRTLSFLAVINLFNYIDKYFKLNSIILVAIKLLIFTLVALVFIKLKWIVLKVEGDKNV